MEEVHENLEMDSQISIIEQSHKNALLNIHENIERLITDCMTIEVHEEDKQSYDKAVELKRVVKQTHINIEKKRKELKQPLIDYGKRLDEFTKTIYDPLVKAEKMVKQKMEAYEIRQEKLKQERKQKEAEEQFLKQQIDNKLLALQGKLGQINTAESKEQLDEIMDYLNKVELTEFGARSGEAGFILNQLKMTCSMAYKVIESTKKEPVVETPVAETPVVETPVAETPVADTPTIQMDVIPQNEEIQKKQSEGRLTREKPLIDVEKSSQKGYDGEVQSKFDWDVPKDEQKDDKNSVPPIINLSDDDIITIIQDVSESYLNDVRNLLSDKYYQFINMKYQGSINRETLELMETEIYKRVGVLLQKPNK